MMTRRKPLFDLTAGDLMCRDPLTVREGTPLRDAARLLLRASVHGAPVVDAAGRCVGVLSVTDLARWGARQADPPALPLPTCPFQDRLPRASGVDTINCRLPGGACSLQVRPAEPAGRAGAVCRDPYSASTEWQTFDTDALPTDDVRHYMTADPVTVTVDADIRTVARVLTDALIHRVIVVDDLDRPVGVVSNTDLVAALVFAREPEPEHPCVSVR